MELGFCHYAPIRRDGNGTEHCFCEGPGKHCCYCKYTEDEIVAQRIARGYVPIFTTDDDGSEENIIYTSE